MSQPNSGCMVGESSSGVEQQGDVQPRTRRFRRGVQQGLARLLTVCSTGRVILALWWRHALCGVVGPVIATPHEVVRLLVIKEALRCDMGNSSIVRGSHADTRQRFQRPFVLVLQTGDLGWKSLQLSLRGGETKVNNKVKKSGKKVTFSPKGKIKVTGKGKPRAGPETKGKREAPAKARANKRCQEKVRTVGRRARGQGGGTGRGREAGREGLPEKCLGLRMLLATGTTNRRA